MPSADTEAAAAPMKIDISAMKPREQLTVPWRGMPIWIIYRDTGMLDSLSKLTDTLRDPLSEQDQQPDYCKNIHRSIKPQFFIAIGICTHLVVCLRIGLMWQAYHLIGLAVFIVPVMVPNMI